MNQAAQHQAAQNQAAQPLTLTGIQHRYSPDVTLSYPDVSLPGGAELVISGPSGVGKTTWLHFLAGLLTPSAGQVRYGEVQINALGEAGRDLFRARTVGYVFQDFHLMPGYSALENVLLGLGLGVLLSLGLGGLAGGVLGARLGFSLPAPTLDPGLLLRVLWLFPLGLLAALPPALGAARAEPTRNLA